MPSQLRLRYVPFHCIFPIREWFETALHQLRFIETRILRPRSLAQPILRCGDPVHLYIHASDEITLLRQISPGDISALIGSMIISVLLRFDHIDKQTGKIESISWRADLIIDHTDGIVCLPDVNHRLDEVLTVQTENPGDADDEELVLVLRYRHLAFQLGLAVVVERCIVLIIGLPRPLALPVEYIVRGKIQEF